MTAKRHDPNRLCCCKRLEMALTASQQRALEGHRESLALNPGSLHSHRIRKQIERLEAMDSQDSEQTSKLKSRNLSEYINSPEGKAALMAVVERKAAEPSKAFPGWDPSQGIPPSLRDHIEETMFGRTLTGRERQGLDKIEDKIE